MNVMGVNDELSGMSHGWGSHHPPHAAHVALPAVDGEEAEGEDHHGHHDHTCVHVRGRERGLAHHHDTVCQTVPHTIKYGLMLSQCSHVM